MEMTNMNRRSWLTRASLLSLTSGYAPWRASAAPAALTLPVKGEFPITETQTCLDNSRWHPLSNGSVRAVQQYLDFKARGTPGLSTANQQTKVKEMFAQLINARPSEVSFVPSTMVGENLVVNGMDIPRSGGNVVTDGLHFEGSTYLYRTLEKQGLDLRVVMPRDWRIEMRDMEKVIDNKTKLVALSLVSFVNGFQHDLKAVCDLAHSHGAYVYADIVQAAGAIPIDVRASGVDFCACASYKWLMGDMGLGFMYCREDLLDKVVHRTQYGYRQIKDYADHIFPYDPPNPSAATWEQMKDAASHFEVGTISSTTVAGLSYSLDYLQKLGVNNIHAHNRSLAERVKKEVPRLGFEPLTPPDSTSQIVSFAVKNPEAVAARLKKANVVVKVDQHLMRVSPSVYNDQKDIDQLLNALS
ncbi:MAG: aminotransferase class V-fold PLP-dependent enzyme [Bryobacteraceae bacterium]|jgi:selenocysteine lyase/cysteine desulfurase